MRGAISAVVTEHVSEFPLRLPRNAFTEDEVPRAGDVWRLCQDAATLASIEAGWPPSRFREEGVFFVVYRMVMVHGEDTPYGTPIEATTWVSQLRRRTLSTREVRLRSGGRLVASATQEWVHVDAETFKPKQGSEATAAAFPPVDIEPSVELPGFEEVPGRETRFELEMWQTWADPLGHANHPTYIDWCDEATSRAMVEAGLSPTELRPVAEQVTFKDSVLPAERVEVTTERIGVAEDHAVVLQHHLTTQRGTAAVAKSIRRLASAGSDALIRAWD